MLGALVVKDLMLIRTRALLGVVAMVAAVVTAARISPMHGLWINMATWIFVGQAGAAEEKSRADVLLGVLPVHRRQVVAGRYLSMLIFALVLCALTAIGSVVAAAAAGRPLDAAPLLPLVLAGAGGTLAFAAFAMPLTAHYGVTRSLSAINLLAILLLAPLPLVRLAAREWPGLAGLAHGLAAHSVLFLTTGAAALGTLAALFSYPLAVYLYERRDL